MQIILYSDEYKNEVLQLILHIQNEEAKINLTLEEQPDLMNINEYYTEKGGAFWLAIEDNTVIGTIGIININGEYGILKKFFVKAEYRNKKIGYALYNELLNFAKKKNISNILLDTPSVAVKSRKFYERAGFRRIEKNELPIDYHYPDRNSFLYMLNIE